MEHPNTNPTNSLNKWIVPMLIVCHIFHELTKIHVLVAYLTVNEQAHGNWATSED